MSSCRFSQSRPRPTSAPHLQKAPDHYSDNAVPDKKRRMTEREMGPFLGREVRMLLPPKKKARWQVGDTFAVSAGSDATWRLRDGPIVPKRSEGILWEWTTINEASPEQHPLTRNSNVAKALSPCIGRRIRMLKGAKLWNNGDEFVIASEGANTWKLEGTSFSVEKKLEGHQWNWLHDELSSCNDGDVGLSIGRDAIVDGSFQAAPPSPDSKQGENSEECIGRQVRLLHDIKKWSVGDVYVVVGSSLRCWKCEGGFMAAKAFEGSQWEWVCE